MITVVAKPGHTGVPRPVELSQSDEQVGASVIAFCESATDIATGDVGANLLGAEMNVNGVVPVEELLQRRIDRGDAALHEVSRVRPDHLAGYGAHIGQWQDDFAEIAARAGMNVGRMRPLTGLSLAHRGLGPAH